MRGKWFVVSLAVGLAGLLAPASAWAWECSVDLQKCIVFDSDHDGDLEDEDCIDPASASWGEGFYWMIFAHNTGANDLSECVITDGAFTSGNFALGAGSTLWVSEAGVCEWPSYTNTAMVECGKCGPDTGSWTDQDSSTIECEKKACFTRTPGYWGTHPNVTEKFLPVTSCGITIDNVGVEKQGSAIEDMCKGGQDFKANDVSPQQLSLVRQCTAAAINLAVTAQVSGDCGSKIDELMATCCDQLCTSGATGQAISESGCIEKLDAFNNSENGFVDDLPLCPSPALGLAPPCSAHPGACQEARNNGFINDRSPAPAAPAAKPERLVPRRTAPEWVPQIPLKTFEPDF